MLSCHVYSLWLPAGKGPISWQLCFVTFPNLFWSTSEIRARFAPWNWFKPSSKIFFWPFQGGTFFVDILFYFCLVFAIPLCLCLYVPCGHMLGKDWPLGYRLWCLLYICHFPTGILGQVWYLIVSIPDICTLLILVMKNFCCHLHKIGNHCGADEHPLSNNVKYGILRLILE